MTERAPRRLTPDEERTVREAQDRLNHRRRAAERAEAEGWLDELIHDIPSVSQQLRLSDLLGPDELKQFRDELIASIDWDAVHKGFGDPDLANE